jgi:hypothetical protein
LFLKAQQLSEVVQKIQLVSFLEAQQLSQVDQKIQLVSFFLGGTPFLMVAHEQFFWA